MQSAGLKHWSDILIVILYFVFVLAVGFWSIWRRKRGNVESFFLAGRSMPWFAVGASLFGSNIGSEHFVGLAGAGAAGGFVLVLFEWIPALLIQLLSWMFLPVFVSAGVYTMPEYIQRRFGGKRLRLYLSFLALILHIATRTAVTIFSGALYIQLALNWNMYTSIIGLLLVTGLFTVLGGLTAVMYTDTAQSVIMVIGAFVVMGMSIDKVGGYSNLPAAYAAAVPSVRENTTSCGQPRSDAFSVLRDPATGDFPWPAMILQCGFASAWYWICDQIMVQRCLAAKNISHAKAGTLLGGYLKILPLFIMVIPGMASRVLFPDEVACVDPEECLKACDNAVGCSNIAYPKLVMAILPAGARGLLMAVMLAAIVTSLTSIFNSSSTVFTMDLWRHFRPKADQRELLIVGRVYIVVLCALTVLWIPTVKSSAGGQLFTYLVVVEGFIAAPLPVLFFLAVFWKRTTEQGAFYGIFITHILGVTRLVLEFVYKAPLCGEEDRRPGFIANVHNFYVSQILMVVQLILMVVISLVTTKRTEVELAGTTWWTRLRSSDSSGEAENPSSNIAMSVEMEAKDTSDSIDYVISDVIPDVTHNVKDSGERTAMLKVNRIKVLEDDTVTRSRDGPEDEEDTRWTTRTQTGTGSGIAQSEEEDQEGIEGVRHGAWANWCDMVCGLPRKVNVSTDISVSSRTRFLRETSSLVKTLNNFFVVLLIATIAFLVGFYK